MPKTTSLFCPVASSAFSPMRWSCSRGSLRSVSQLTVGILYQPEVVSKAKGEASGGCKRASPSLAYMCRRQGWRYMKLLLC